MAMSMQEMSDRFEIQDLLVGYCYAVDARDFDRLDRYFTTDAVIDYSQMVGFKGNLAETKAFLRQSFGMVAMAQHAVSTTRYEIDGDRATTKTVCYNPMVVRGPDAQEATVVFGLWYVHQHVRTDDGWRISHLHEEKCYSLGIPDWLRAHVA